MTKLASTLLAALLGLPGCLGSDDDAGLPPEDLADREFVSNSVTEDRGPRLLEPDTEIKLSFRTEEGREVLGWEAGCNSAGADVEVTDDRLIIDGDRIVTTLVGCPRPLMAQDAWLSEFFEADPEWNLTRDQLTLTSGETVIAFSPQP